MVIREFGMSCLHVSEQEDLSLEVFVEVRVAVRSLCLRSGQDVVIAY